MSQLTTCPVCAEEIQTAARKCKHCGEWLDDAQPLRTPEPVQLPTCRAVFDDNAPDVSEAVARGLHRADLSEIRSAPNYLAAGLLAFVGGVVAGGITGAVWIGVVVFLLLIAVLGAKPERERKF